MKNNYPSILNDVLAPVTPGPSSSNTTAPCRLARTMLDLLHNPLKHILIEMSDKGGFPFTFYGMRSDLGFLAGFMGKDNADYDLSMAYQDFKKKGLEYTFSFVPDLPPKPDELVRITMTDEYGITTQVMGASIGGGGILIDHVNGYDVHIDGKNYCLLILLKDTSSFEADRLIDMLRHMLDSEYEISKYENSGKTSIQIISNQEISDQIIDTIRNTQTVLEFSKIRPVYPCVRKINAVPPYTNCREMKDYIHNKGCSILEAILDYETAVSNFSPEEIMEYAGVLLDTAYEGIHIGMSGKVTFPGIIKPMAAELKESFRHKELLDLGIINQAAPEAIAIMEHSNAYGRIVCMPTGGSSGIIPGILHAAAQDLNLTRPRQEEALLVAGIFGLFLYKTNYSGFLGCQAEVGSATAMAAAMLTYLMDADIEKIENAGSMGLQSLMGLLCDPVAGLVQVPCILRNATAAATAATIANLAASGYPAVIPYDEMAESLYQVGINLDSVNFCGTCTTCTGKKLENMINQERKMNRDVCKKDN